MTHRSLARRILIGTIAVIAPMHAGCNCQDAPRTGSVTATPSTATTQGSTGPAIVTMKFVDPKTGVELQFPSTWKAVEDKDVNLHVIPADGSPNRSILLDIPDLPFHVPGMIPMGLTENGYVNDLKEKHPDAKVDQSADHPIPGCPKARLVESSWTENGKAWKDVGLIMIRTDSVFVLSARSDADSMPAVRADFDKIVGTLAWSK